MAGRIMEMRQALKDGLEKEGQCYVIRSYAVEHYDLVQNVYNNYENTCV